ncbi:serine/threonine-protein kinase [Dokdonella immobilis]|uniref:Serine/threonine protein kinase n=1 Tax=Dokdonella immobilis TaxID=578942 RepID=A0A1I4Y2U1_9GAMM|nr:serine/threonine-protein kinase [Dokdonella immobilis]SFN32357.1 serine/threonine protein kinase [Dokdonella immobilis]
MSTATERWAEVAALFDELAELEHAVRAQRLAALDESDPALAAEVRALLAADDTPNPLLDGELAGVVVGIPGVESPASAPAGKTGPWRLLRPLGEGGMGVVWLAERIDGAYEQQVAVKVLKRGMDTQAILRRFLQERRILARLNHPNIVRLVDGGMGEDERPYYVMDYVDGQSITRHAADHHLDVSARMRLLARVADAVAYAHAQLVIHRDLKPSNVLVDHQGEPRVLDFGIAKLIEESGEQTQTGTGLRVMSPAYAAPEQILGEPIGTATDVYALGLMLCELLVGQLPRQRRGSTPAQLALEASQEVTDRASTLAARLTGAQLQALYGETADPRQLSRMLSGDLDLIVATALQREPARRYATAAAFADDLRRWLDGRPIAARADSPGYRLKKFMRRHRLGVAASVIVAFSLIGGLGVALWQAQLARAEAQRADLERGKAERQLARSERVKDFILTLFREQDPISRASATARTPVALIRDGIAQIDSSLAGEPELRAQLLKDLGEIQISLDDREAARATLKRAWELQSSLSGADSIATAEVLAAYGDAVYAVGDVPASAALLRDALTKLRQAGAGNLPRAALAESSLANIELVEGSNAEAEKLARHGVEVFRETYGAEDIRVASRLGVLGKVQQEAGNYPDALASYREALAIVARNNGEDHVRTAMLRTNVGDILRVQHKYDEARVEYETALRIERAQLPDDHLFVGGTLLRLGDLQRRMGNLEAAEASFAESIAILGKTPSGQYAQALQTYGTLARAQGRFELAAQRYRKSFEAFQAATGDSVYTWITALLEVSALTAAERFVEADRLGADALAALARVSPDDRYNNTFAASVVGSLRLAESRFDDATPLLRRALEGVQAIYDKDHAEIAQARVALAAALLGQQESALRGEAAALIETAIETLTRAGDAGSEPMLGAAYLERSRFHEQGGNLDAARADVVAAMARLRTPEYAPKLRQAEALARKLGAPVGGRA